MSVCELIERVASPSVNVDQAAAIIRHVKVIGTVSRNGRTYSEAALRGALPMYEGAGIFVDHPTQPGNARSYRDRVGTLRSVRFEGGAVYGDLHLNPGHPMTEQLLWDAKNNPTAVGLSHNSVGRMVQRNGSNYVEEITRVVSVDLVVNPASTAGLFESQGFTMPAMTTAEFVRELKRRDPEPATIKQTRTAVPDNTPISVPSDLKKFVRILRSH